MARKSSGLIDERKLDEQWHTLDKRCQGLGERCPRRARDEIAEAANRIGQADEYAERQHFLRLARTALYAANKSIETVLTVTEITVT